MRLKGLFKRLLRNRKGTAAVEMAFVMPVFVIAGLGVADLGLYVHEEMQVKQSIRSGAQAALMGIQDTDALAQIIVDSADRGTTTSASFGGGAITASVVRSCGCQGRSVATSCTAICTDGTVPSIYFDLNAQTLFTGIIVIPNKTVNSSMRVKTR